MKKLEVGKTYRFVDNFKREPLLTGKLLEIDGNEARVEIAAVHDVGNIRNIVIGEVLRVYLPMAIAEAV